MAKTNPVGFVKTAKGKVLNFAELKEKSKRPIENKKIDLRNKIIPQARSADQINVIGFIPSTDTVAPAPHVKIPENNKKIPDVVTMSDITGVVIKKTRHLKQIPEDPMGMVNQTLVEITNDLANMKKTDPGKK